MALPLLLLDYRQLWQPRICSASHLQPSLSFSVQYTPQNTRNADDTVTDSNTTMSWWEILTNPKDMFPNVPYSVAVILYSSIVIAVLIIILALMWICTCIASRRKSKKDTMDEPIVENRVESPTRQDNSYRTPSPKASERKDGDTLKHLENMPWWDYISKHPCVNWYDYYRMVEGKTRSRTCRRHCHPCGSHQDRRSGEKSPFHKRSNLGLPYADVDSGWERIRPSHVDLSPYYCVPKSQKPGFFPRFPMIPRANWTNERLMGHMTSNLGEEYTNRSMASLNSTDMQVMQMIAKKRQMRAIRPHSGDVFFGHYVSPQTACTHHVGSAQNPQNPASPYEVHNWNVAHRHSSGMPAQQAAQSSGTNPAPWSPPAEGDVFLDSQPQSQLPSPPEYPPPPVPLTQSWELFHIHRDLSTIF